MPSNNDLDFLRDLADQISEPNERMLEEFRKSEKHKILSNKLSIKADKLIIRDSKANRKAMLKRPGGFAGRIARRAGGAAMGGIGNAMGGIPIVGAIFRAIGQEAAATLKDRKNYQKELTRQRRIELKLMEQYEAARRKKEQDALDAANPEPGKRGSGGGGAGSSGGTAASAHRLANAAVRLEAAAISLTPAIKTFDDTVVRIQEILETMGNNDPSRVRDAQALEYLHAIEFYSQETAAQVEKMSAKMDGGLGRIGRNGSNVLGSKAIEYLHAIEFYSQESAAQVEKIQADFEPLMKDINLIRQYSWKTNLTTVRIEALLKKAAVDRLKEIDIEKEQLKLQRKQLDSQEETKLIGVLGLLSNLLGGGGGMLGMLGGLFGKGGKGGMIGKLLKGGLRGGLVGAAAFGAFEIGKAIGEELAKYLDGNKTVENFMFRIFDIFDNVLAKMGDPDAIARVKNRDDQAWGYYAQDLAKQSGLPQLDAATEDYVRKNHTLPGMDADTFANKGITGGLFNTTIGAKSPEEMATLMQNWQLDQAKPALPGQDLIPASVGLEDAKADAMAKKEQRQQAINQTSQVNNNNQTVVPQPLSADPAGGVSKSRNLGD